MADDEYDVAISFAGEDREQAESLANELRARRLRVFYDGFERADLWGKDLYSHLNDVYSRRARYTLMLISAAYASKVWTNHERRSAQARALRDNRDSILPLRLDDSPVEGLLDTTGYITWNEHSVTELADFVVQKITAESALRIRVSALGDAAQSAASRNSQNPVGVETPDDLSLAEFAAMGLARALAKGLNNMRVWDKYPEVVGEGLAGLVFDREETWKQFGEIIEITGAARRDYDEAVRMLGLRPGASIGGHELASLVFRPSVLSARDHAARYASLCEVSLLLQRRLLTFFERGTTDLDESVNEYLLLRDDIARELTKHSVTCVAAYLFYIDVAVLTFARADVPIDLLLFDRDLVATVHRRIVLAIDTAGSFEGRPGFACECSVARKWKDAVEGGTSDRDLVKLAYQDIDETLHLVG